MAEVSHFLKPAIVNGVAERNAPQNAVGWFGGSPSFPDGQGWPISQYSGPMVFICQIDLQAIPSEVWDGLAPRDGWLSFFMNGDEEGAVIHTNELGGPIELPGSYAEENSFSFSNSPGLYAKHWLTCDLTQDGAPELIGPHKLGGKPDFLQDGTPYYGDLSSEERQKIGLSPSKVPAPFTGKLNRLLLQVGSDYRLDCSWGAGSLYFIIADEDLAAGRYDRVHMHYESF